MIRCATEVALQGRTPSYHSKSVSETPYALLNGVCREDREWPQSGSRRTSDNAMEDLIVSSVLISARSELAGTKNTLALTQINRDWTRGLWQGVEGSDDCSRKHPSSLKKHSGHQMILEMREEVTFTEDVRGCQET